MKIDWKKFGIDVPYGRTSGHVKVYCPQCRDQRHNKRDKSLSCDLAKGLFKCHHCGWQGTAVVRDESDKRKWMQSQPWFKLAPPRHEKPVYKKPTHTGSAALSDNALAWFKGRGISAQTLTLMKVTEGMEWMPQKNAEANTVQFNYYKRGELVNTKYRTADKCFKMCQGAELLPWNIDAISDTTECVITEGEMDALSFIECGRTDVVSVPNGANASLNYLDDYIEDYFDNKETVYLACDSDAKGVELRDALLHRFGMERCRVLRYGDGCKDANEHLQRYGRQSLLDCLASAPELNMEGIFSLSDFEESLDAIYEYGLQRGVTIGHSNFDELCSFETKRLCIVTGIPGSGKSEFIDEMAERLNMRYGWRFAFFSPENLPLAYHASKLVEKFTGQKFSRETLPADEYRQVKRHLEQDFFFLCPKDNFRLEGILERARFLVRRKGIKALVIDPYNRLESVADGLTETQHVSVLLDRLTNFAQQNNVLVILVAHPTKLLKNKEGVLEPPTLYDISGSANFYNKADFGIVVHRNKLNKVVEVHVQKVRFRHLGKGGVAMFKYNITNGRYVPYVNETAPVWDNTNHLREQERERAELEADTTGLLFGDDMQT